MSKSEENKKTKLFTVCAIGHTGTGKSTMLNRFCGDFSKRGDQEIFKTSTSSKSETSTVSSINRTLKYNNHELKHLNGEVAMLIDTPGLADTEGRDKEIIKMIREFFEKTCDGVNVFAIVFNVTNVRYDTNIQNLLNGLTKAFGKGFWNHVILVFVRNDCYGSDFINSNEYTSATAEFPKRIQKDFKLDFPLTVTDFGINNYTKGIKDIVSFGKSKGLFVCKYMKSWKVASQILFREERIRQQQMLLEAIFGSFLNFKSRESELKGELRELRNDIRVQKSKRCVIL